MPKNHGDLSKRKQSGGRRRRYREKRVYELGGEAAETRLGTVRLNENAYVAEEKRVDC